jgi:hypothetical protein
MHWFEGIGWNTPVRDIGWTYVLLASLLIYFIVQLIRNETAHRKMMKRRAKKDR